MTLNFLNPSRSYNASRDCVSFWGHDAQFEVSFHIGSDALQRLDGRAGRDEDSLLKAFDGHLARIQKVAGQLFSRHKQAFYRLSASDF